MLHSFQRRWKNICLDNTLRGLHGILFKDTRNYVYIITNILQSVCYFPVHMPLVALHIFS